MALVQVRIGSLPDIGQFDDGEYDTAIETTKPISVGASAAGDHAVRQDELPGAPADSVHSTANIADNKAVRGDGGAKGVQGSNVDIDDSGNIDIPTGTGYKVNGNQVVTDQQAAEADITSGAITDPADAPADADALRDDLVANALVEIAANFAALDTKINNILAKLRTHGLIDT